MLNSGKQGGTSLSLSLRQLHTLEQGSRLFHEPLPQLVADYGYILDAYLACNLFSLFQHFSQDSNLVSLEVQYMLYLLTVYFGPFVSLNLFFFPPFHSNW